MRLVGPLFADATGAFQRASCQMSTRDQQRSVPPDESRQVYAVQERLRALRGAKASSRKPRTVATASSILARCRVARSTGQQCSCVRAVDDFYPSGRREHDC